MLRQSISKNSLLLALFALATAAILASTWHLTWERIEAEKRKAAQRALLEIIPLSRHDNDILGQTINLSAEDSAELGLRLPGSVHIASLQGTTVAYIYPATARDGYSGDIDMIIGININGSIAGVRVLSHKETPGLGDKVDLKKSDWILTFAGKSLKNPESDQWKVKKDGGDFDQFTGATITPRAVVNRVRQTLEYHQKFIPDIASNKTESASAHE